MSKSFYKNDHYASDETMGKHRPAYGAERKKSRQTLHNLVYYQDAQDLELAEMYCY